MIVPRSTAEDISNVNLKKIDAVGQRVPPRVATYEALRTLEIQAEFHFSFLTSIDGSKTLLVPLTVKLPPDPKKRPQ